MVVAMSDGVHDLLGVHACACNGRVVETLGPWWTAHAKCVCDGALVGEGPEALRRTLESEFRDGLVARVVDVDGVPAVVAFDGPEGTGRPRVMLRLEVEADRVTVCRIEHPV